MQGSHETLFTNIIVSMFLRTDVNIKLVIPPCQPLHAVKKSIDILGGAQHHNFIFHNAGLIQLHMLSRLHQFQHGGF